jgi:hypothetical protein
MAEGEGKHHQGDQIPRKGKSDQAGRYYGQRDQQQYQGESTPPPASA